MFLCALLKKIRSKIELQILKSSRMENTIKRSKDWVVALEQRTDLSITHGNISELANAIRHGADLRLYMTTDNYEETLYFQQTYAGEGDTFAGLMSHHHGYIRHEHDVEQPISSIFKYDISGTFSLVRGMWSDVMLDASRSYPYRVYRWFICDRWRLVYEHDADGNNVYGNLEELKEYIRLGRSVQVGIRQLFGLADDTTEGPLHISFVTTMQPLIQDGHVLSNCDLIVIGAPQWPFTWKDGLDVAMMWPSTSGEIHCFLTGPGKISFRRMTCRRAMQWMVAERV